MARTTLLTAEEAASYLRVNVNTLRRYVRERRIRAARLGKGYRIRQEDLDAFLATLADAGEPPLTADEVRESEAGWAEYLAGHSKPLDQVIQEQLRDRTD